MTSFVVFFVQLADRTSIIQQRSFSVIINYLILTEPRVQRVVLVYNKKTASAKAEAVLELEMGFEPTAY